MLDDISRDGHEAGAILLVDDDRLVARAHARALACEMVIVRAESADEALACLASREDWLLFVIDVKLGRDPLRGLDLLASAREPFPEVPAVVVTGRDDPTLSHRARELRAGFLSKPAPKRILRTWLDDARAFARKPLTQEEQVDEAGRIFHLTPVQATILSLVVQRRSQRAIAELLQLKEDTVNDHVRRIRDKAKVASTPELTAIVERIRRRSRTVP